VVNIRSNGRNPEYRKGEQWRKGENKLKIPERREIGGVGI